MTRRRAGHPPTTAVGPDGTTRTVPPRVAMRVWVTAGGRCSMCNRYLVVDEYTGQPVFTGQLAHIVGWTTAPGSPRGDEPLPTESRNTAYNLMLLCHDQHRVIDDLSLWDTYDAEALRRIKYAHENRIRRLTELQPADRSAVLRVVGTLHGRAVELSAGAVAATLLADGRYPDYALQGVDPYEIDLRRLAREEVGEDTYWSSAWNLIQDLVTQLKAHVHRENIRHLSVFAIARVPLLVALGTLLDDTIPTVIYPRRRDAGEGWGFDPEAADVDFLHTRLQVGTDPHRVAVLFSISGTVDRGRLPSTMDETTSIYELRPTGVTPHPDLITTPGSVDAFTRSWRRLLAELEEQTPGLSTIDVFPAVPITAAISIGRAPMRATHPRLRIYDRGTADPTYRFAVETS